MNVQVKIRYFALLKDLVGHAEESLLVPAGTNAGDVYLRLAEKYAFPLALTDVRVAVNDEFTTASHPLQPNDLLVFIPPVAGG
jgi:molybdopterin synthase sulfur carrier subunit